MSYDLWVWKGPIPPDEEAFAALLERFYEDDVAAFDASTDVTSFHADLLKRFPALENLDGDNISASPWSMTPDVSDRLIEMSVVWPMAVEMEKAVRKLARARRLLMTDSASGRIVRP